MSLSKSRYAADFKHHEVTRVENDRNLLHKLDAIRVGEDIDSLERFAKAYLGMFLDIDNNIPPRQRIDILANPELANAITAGFEAVLREAQFPDEESIADAMIDELPLAMGYILLAALDLFAEDPRYAITRLPAAALRSAVCFHYAAKTEIKDKWFEQILLQRQSDVAQALSVFWQRLIMRECDYLPGLYHIIQDPSYDAISEQVVPPVLESLRHCRKGVLRDLLHAALRICNHAEIYRICETALVSWNRADPARYVLWLSTAFILHPDRHDLQLAEYCGRSKEKILPLLDFTYLVLVRDHQHRLSLNAEAHSQLLRIIAAKFAPQLDRYGKLSDNTQKLMYLFFRLATADDSDTADAIARLGQVRVMKLYKEILQVLPEIHSLPDLDFDGFLARLEASGAIRPRKNWSDLGH